MFNKGLKKKISDLQDELDILKGKLKEKLQKTQKEILDYLNIGYEKLPLKLKKKAQPDTVNDGFTFIYIQQPPISSRPILVKLSDKWRGEGRETEIVTATYDGTTYKTLGGKQIPKRVIVGWKNLQNT